MGSLAIVLASFGLTLFSAAGAATPAQYTGGQAQQSAPAPGDPLRGPLPEENAPPVTKPFNPPTQYSSSGMYNRQPQSSLLSQQEHEHQKGLFSRALGGAASDVGHATMAFVGTAILNGQNVDLPPDDETNPEWPFKAPHRKSLYTVDWADGTSAKISRLPDGSYQILGGGRRYILQPEGEGKFALFGDFGTMASVTPRPGGGFVILKADGTAEQVLPREGGGFTVSSRNGVVATILPGVAGKKHTIRGSGVSDGFIQ